MAIDQAFGERGGISPIRFISFPAALTFPFAHSNWQNKIPVLGSHPSAPRRVITPPLRHTLPPPQPFCSSIPPSLKSAASSWRSKKHKQSVRLLSEECVCHRVCLRSGVTCINHLRGRAHFNFSFSSHHYLSGLPHALSTSLVSPFLALPAYPNNSFPVQPSPRIIISISLPDYWPATHSQGVSQPSISFRRNFLTPSTLGVKRALFKRDSEQR